MKKKTTEPELKKILEEIDLLEDEWANNFSGSEGEILYTSGALDACKAIKEIIRKHMSGKDTDVPVDCGWIPVEEQLPEEKKSVLVQWEKYDRHLNVTLTYLDVMWLDDAEEKAFETINGVPNGKIIAWRHLPEPYWPGGRAANKQESIESKRMREREEFFRDI